MRKILFVLIFILIATVSFAGTPSITHSNASMVTNQAPSAVTMEAINQALVTTSALIWYGNSIGGYGSIDFYVTGVSGGSAISTLSAQAIYQNGTAVTAAQTLTSGTPITSIKSAFYKFSIPASATTRNVSFNFIIKN